MRTSSTERRLSTLYTPISIKVDYTYLESQNLLPSGNLSKLKSVISETINALSALLEVKHQDTKLDKDDIEESCEIPKVASDYSNFLYENDVLILPYIDEEYDDEVLAAATPCLTLNNYQPKVGVLALNKNMDFDKKDIYFYFKMLLLHEITHILIFEPEILEKIDMISSEKKNGKTLYYVNSSKVL